MPEQVKTNNDMHINLSGVLTILITLFLMVFTYDTSSGTINWGTTLCYIILYFILALTTGEFKKTIDSGLKGIMNNMKIYLKKIYYGKISPPQAFWIFAYISYRILISSNFFNVPIPFNIIITIAFVIGLSLTNKRIKTLTETVKDIFIMKPLDRLMEENKDQQEEVCNNTIKGRKIKIKRC